MSKDSQSDHFLSGRQRRLSVLSDGDGPPLEKPGGVGIPKLRKRANSDLLRDRHGRPFQGENWRKSVYQPLNPNRKEIRVLILFPSRYLDSEIICHLGAIDLEQFRFNFDAISYVWGDQSEKKFIQLNGFRIRIGIGAYTALRNVRDPRDLRLLWIDSLCINQADIVERGRQVRLMKDIYTQAYRVMLCVCEQSRFANTAARILQDVAYLSVRSAISRGAGQELDTAFNEAGEREIEELTQEEWDSIRNSLSNLFGEDFGSGRRLPWHCSMTVFTERLY